MKKFNLKRKSLILFRMLSLLSGLFLLSLNNTVSAKGTKTLIIEQDNLITGKVTDEKGLPMPGVSVMVPGTNIITATSEDGTFKMRVPDQAERILFRFIGYQTKELLIANRNTINVQLLPNDTNLNEVVVIGYGSVKRKDLTGSVGSVKSKELNTQKAPSFIEAMQGKVAGVQISSQSGEPGAGVSINIRGGNSINASSQPLYVIDGVQIDPQANQISVTQYATDRTNYNPMASINPQDIESIEVLKDASSTAIYGSRGANGVIVVTTKSGRAGTMKVDLDLSAGISTNTRKIPVLNGHDYADYMHFRNPSDSTFGTGIRNPLNSAFPQTRYYDDLTQHDWQKEMYRTGKFQNHNLSFNGGSSKVTYAVGLGMYDQDGQVQNNSYKRFNGRTKLDITPNDRLKYGVTMDYSSTNSYGLIGQTGPNSYLSVPSDALITRPLIVALPGESVSAIRPPTNLITNSDKKVTLDRLMGEVYLEYEFLKNLRIRINGGINNTNSKGSEFYGKDTDWGFNMNGFATLSNAISKSFFERNLLTYETQINKRSRLSALLGFEVNGYNFENFRIQNNNFQDESTGFYDIGKGIQPQIPTSYWEESQLASYLGRVNYTFDEKYLFTASFRADGSSKFGSNNKFGYFPSGAFAWRINQEEFLKNVKQIDNLKLRLSYGVTGNDRIPSYSGAPRLSNGSFPSNDNLVFGLAPASLENKNLKWESTAQSDAGIDVELFKSRISFTADIYYKKTSDMLLQVAVPAQSGYDTQFQNVGSLENKGLELSLNTVNIRSENFTWSTSFNVSFNRNKVLDIGSRPYLEVSVGGGWQSLVGRVEKGRPIGQIYGFQSNGIYQAEDFSGWQNNSDPNILIDQRDYVLKPGVPSFSNANVKPGDLKFKDINGDGIVDQDNDRTYIGNTNPLYYGGFTNTFNFRKEKFGELELSLLFTYSYGNKVYNAGNYWLSGIQGSFNMSQRNWDNAWKDENHQSNTIARPGVSTLDFVSSYNVEDASFIRLSNLTLGYTLPRQALSKLRLSNTRFFITAQNLFVITKYRGYDPEVSSYNPLLLGYDQINGPRPLTLLLGIHTSF